MGVGVPTRGAGGGGEARVEVPGRAGVLEHRDGDILVVHPGMGATFKSRRSVSDIRGDAGSVYEIRELGVVVFGIVFPGASVDEVDEFPEDGELELELDAVDDALEHGLHDVEVDVFDDEEADVHSDDDHVDSNELIHDFTISSVGIEAEHLGRFPDVEGGDDELLQTEAGHLDLLHDVVAVDEGDAGRCGEVGAVCQDGGGDVEDNGVDDDHGEDASQDAPVVEDEVEPRVQHDRLSGHHAPPADGEEGDGQPCDGGQVEELEEEAQRVGHDADGGAYQKTPEIQPAILTESDEYQDNQLNGIVPGDTGKRGDGDLHR